MVTHTTDIAIVGGGLSGLTTAYRLAEANLDFQLLEAGATLGGRIQSIRDKQDNSVLADLGPTWVWPQFQPSIGRWIDKLGLQLHAQYEDGLGVYEDGSDNPAQHVPFPGQQGIARISGGPQALVDRLAESMPPDSIHLNSPVKNIVKNDGDYTLTLASKPSEQIVAKRIVIAAPLRIAIQIEGLAELLPENTARFIKSVPTWMAVHAKVSVVYDRPFWREAGFSGRVASRLGPLVEMHDISGETGTPAALFGFCGVPAHLRDQVDLEAGVLSQLKRCFGEKASNPIAMEIKDWAEEAYICSDADREGMMSHPQRLPDMVRDGYQDNSLFLGVSETANADPGLIAGALDAGERVAHQLMGA